MKHFKNVCFAYFGDNKFIGWYADTGGSIRKHPKIYTNSKDQIEVIVRNFRSKMEKSKLENIKENYSKKYFAIGPEEAMKLMISSHANDYEKLNAFENIELRLVGCPIYDGPNPDFDKEDYEKWNSKKKDKMKQEGILDLPVGLERNEAIKKFDISYGHYPTKRWIYPVWNELKEWCKEVPTEFIGVITETNSNY